ncbi:MAG: porin, partial [Duodenibacillus sp.]|nr:porin [Duodenibacillus sp.]
GKEKSSSKQNVYNVAVNYGNGPFFAMASYLYQDYRGSQTGLGYALDGTGDPSIKERTPKGGNNKKYGQYINVAASYDFGFTKPSVLFMKKIGDNKAPATSPNFWIAQIGTATPCFGGRWSVSAAMLHNQSQDDANAWSLGTRFDYPLSKRTKVYVGAEFVKNDKNTKYSVEAGPDSTLHFTNSNGKNQGQFFFGINHKF